MYLFYLVICIVNFHSYSVRMHVLSTWLVNKMCSINFPMTTTGWCVAKWIQIKIFWSYEKYTWRKIMFREGKGQGASVLCIRSWYRWCQWKWGSFMGSREQHFPHPHKGDCCVARLIRAESCPCPISILLTMQKLHPCL